MSSHRPPRFFSETLSPDKPDIVIKGREFYHLKNVIRINTGEEIIVFDGKGSAFLAELKIIGKKEAVACIKERLPSGDESGFKIVIAQGIAKGEKMDMIIQKASELGASSIVPFTTARTVPNIKNDKGHKRLERWKKIAIESSKQCGRNIVPKIEAIKPYEEMLSGWDDYLKIILWEDAPFPQLRESLTAIKESNYKGIIAVIGAEGGFSQGDISSAKRHGFKPVRLFSNILRTETASIAVLAIIKYELG